MDPTVPPPPPPDVDRRHHAVVETRGRARVVWDLVFALIRLVRRHAHNAYATFGVLLLAGAAVAVASTWAFARLASHVASGRTQRFDEAVMHWIATHRYPALENTMVEITALGTGLVVTMLVLVAGLFLYLNDHRPSAYLLVVTNVGGILLNNLLKLGFDRPRPQIFDWGTHALTSSFPSGHAMSAAIVYGTVAYLAARLQSSRGSRLLTLGLAGTLIMLIAASRVYLGVHYPSDVLAGLVIGIGWAAFCLVLLEASQLWGRRNAPQMVEDERPGSPEAPPVTG
jgi:undecaprenyl-diphosphatase